MENDLKKLQRIKNIWDTPDYNEAVKKARRMSTHDMINWISNSLNDIGKAVMDYQKHGEMPSLLELRYAVSVMQALVEELIVREDNS